jgi:hypothetical protein
VQLGVRAEAGGEVALLEVVEDAVVVEEHRQVARVGGRERRGLRAHDRVVPAGVDPLERLDAREVAEVLRCPVPHVVRHRQPERSVREVVHAHGDALDLVAVTAEGRLDPVGHGLEAAGHAEVRLQQREAPGLDPRRAHRQGLRARTA